MHNSKAYFKVCVSIVGSIDFQKKLKECMHWNKEKENGIWRKKGRGRERCMFINKLTGTILMMAGMLSLLSNLFSEVIIKARPIAITINIHCTHQLHYPFQILVKSSDLSCCSSRLFLCSLSHFTHKFNAQLLRPSEMESEGASATSSMHNSKCNDLCICSEMFCFMRNTGTIL